MTTDLFEKIWQIMQKFKFVLIDSISDEMKCGLCTNLLIRPCNIPCGCRFCYDCIHKYLNQTTTTYCPNNLKYCQLQSIDFDTHVEIDHPMNIRLSQIKVKCINKDCEFQDELSAIENHIKICNKSQIVCPLFLIGCEKNDLNHEKIDEHILNQIYFHFKLIATKLNNISIGDFNSDRSQLDNSQFIPKQEKIDKSLKDKYFELQQIKQEMENMKKENKSIKEEISILKKFKGLKETSDHNFASLINRLDQDLKDIRKENIIEKNQFESLKEIIMEIQLKSDSEIQNSMNLKKVSESIVTDQKKLLCAFEDRELEFSQNLRQLEKLINKNIQELQIRLMEIEFESGKSEKNGYFNWRIDNFSKIWKEIKKSSSGKLYSDSFVSHQKGYKMCLCLWQKEEYLCVGFSILTGPYDNTLEWPCKLDVTIDLIDQKTVVPFTTCVLKFSSYSGNDAWKKPKNDKAIGLGEKLINLDLLLNNYNLVKNDKIFLKCNVNNL